MPTIPQRELRNNVSEVLRRAEAGERFTVTVDGRPVAEVGPRRPVRAPGSREGLARVLRHAPSDGAWARELDDRREEDRAAARDVPAP